MRNLWTRTVLFSLFLGLPVLAAAQTPAAQSSATQSSATQSPAPQTPPAQTAAPQGSSAQTAPAQPVTAPPDVPLPRNYQRFNFNVGGGYGIGRGEVSGFVGNSFEGTAGAGFNFSRMVGVNAEYMYYDLNFRPSVARSQDLNNANGSLNAVSLDGIIRSPYHLGRYGAYGIFGVGFYYRNTYSSTGLLQPGSLCQPAWVWWDIYCSGEPPSVPATPTQSLGSYTKIAGGYNWGGGITYDLNRWHRAKVFGEFRYHKAYFSDDVTVVWPLTVGLRW